MEHTAVEKRRLDIRCRRFGIDYDQYMKMYKEQDGNCFICQKPCLTKPNSTTKVSKVLAIDHDHKTGKVRGLLCSSCNTSLGKFEDSVEILQRAIEYLQRDYSVEPISQEKKYVKRRDEYKLWRRLVYTPDRAFTSAEEAGRHYNVDAATIWRWLGYSRYHPMEKKEGWSDQKIMISLIDAKKLVEEYNVKNKSI